MPDNFIDLTVTSPPYNVDLGNNKYNNSPYDVYDDKRQHSEYIVWLRETFTIIYKKTKHGGRCVINIGDGQNGRIPTHSDIIQLMLGIGWLPMATIIWDKKNCSSRTAWGSFNSPSAPSFPIPFEYIMIFSKGDRKIQYNGNTDLEKQQFIDWSYGIWQFPGENIGLHPAAFPIDIPIRCIKMLTWIDAVVYDPFMGSGTTAIASHELKRKWIGSEISSQYCEIARKRIEPYLQQTTLF
jgi:site-specific DNA-methyltransferase (adenine-specific)